MGIFDFLKNKPRRFIEEANHRRNLEQQREMTPQIVSQLRLYDVTADSRLRLEYFFYTDTAEKAAALARRLSLLGYSAETGRSGYDEKIRVITGWTNPLEMSAIEVLDWVERMCHLGFEFDCEFDGWGTNPDQ